MNTLDTCRAYLAKLPPAVSGAGGHDATRRAACECIRFGLGDGDALALLREFSRRCEPPWTEKELAHKLKDARLKAGGQIRTFTRPRPAVRVVWHLKRKPMACVAAGPLSSPAACPIAAEPSQSPPSAERLARLNRPPAPQSEDKTEIDRILPTTSNIMWNWPTGKAAARHVSRGGTTASWLHVATQILAGEFDGADNSTVQSLTIGLRGIRHALCQQALIRLKRTG